MGSRLDAMGKFLSSNFDKLLLVAIFAGICQMVIHLTHDNRDGDLVLWAREMAGTVLGGLLGLITGHALATRAIATTVANPEAPIVTVTTEEKL